MIGSGPASTPPAEPQLVQVGATDIIFANNTYQFIELRHFALPAGGEATDRGVLAALVASPGYRGSFVGTGDGDPTIHGPYRAAAISADSFVSVSAADAEILLRTWAEYAASLPDAVRVDIEREIYARLGDASAVYRLPTLADDARETEWRLGLPCLTERSLRPATASTDSSGAAPCNGGHRAATPIPRRRPIFRFTRPPC